MPELNLYCQSLGWDSGKMGVLMVGLGIVDSRIRLLLWCAVGGLFSVALYGTGQVTAAASPGPLGQPISDSVPPAPKKKAREPSQMPEPTPTPAPTRQSPNLPSGGLGSPTGGMGQPNEVQVDARSGRYPSFGQGDDSYGIEMSLWPEDMETVNGLLQWRVNIVRFSPNVSSNYRTPVRPDGFVSGVGSVAATMSLTQNGTCISVLSIDGAPMAQIEVACSRGPGLMFRVLKLPHQTRWIVLSAVYRETEGTPTVVREFLADMWTNKVWPVSDFRAEGFTVEPCSNEAKVLWNSASAQRLGLRVSECLSTVFWPPNEGRLAGREAGQPKQLAPARPESRTAQDETASWMAGYRDKFLGGDDSVTVSAKARERNYPTSDGSIVLREIEPGKTIKGRWVQGRDPTTRWFKVATTHGYVWEGNVTHETPGAYLDGSAINLWQSGRLPDWQAAGAGIQYAMLSSAAYYNLGNVETPNGTWVLAETWESIIRTGLAGTMSDTEISAQLKKISDSGFSATLYRKGSQYVLVFRGTEFLNRVDWQSNFAQWRGRTKNTQYEYANLISNIISGRSYSDIVYTGHSLGGGLAQYAAYLAYSASFPPSKIRAVTFNSAGIGPEISPGTRTPNVVNFTIDDEAVSLFGQQIGSNQYIIINPIAGYKKINNARAVSLPLQSHGIDIVIMGLDKSWRNRPIHH